jgi:hypothetical protein
MRTLLLLLQRKENKESLSLISSDRENDFVIRINSKLPPEEFQRALDRIINETESADALADPSKIPLTDKFDYLLPPGLLLKQYAANMLDLEELR